MADMCSACDKQLYKQMVHTCQEMQVQEVQAELTGNTHSQQL